MSLIVKKSEPTRLQQKQESYTVSSPDTKRSVFIKSDSSNKIADNKKREELRARIIEKEEKLEKIQNLLNKKQFNQREKAEYIRLTESKTKSNLSQTCALGFIAGSSGFFWGVALGVGTIATGGAALALACGIGLIGIGMYNSYEAGNMISIEHSPYQCERQANYAKTKQEIHQKMINNLKIAQAKTINEIKVLKNELGKLKN